MNLKDQLKKKGKSIRSIAAALKLNHSTVIQILNGKYDGKDTTTERVIRYVKFVLIDKEDLNEVIYSNPELFIRAFSFAMRSLKNFSDDESLVLIETSLKLKKYKKHLESENLNQNDK